MNLSVDRAGVTLKNPVMTASGTFGSGQEFSEFVDLNQLGAVVTKGVANIPWAGNSTPRVAEVYGGMLNAVGLQNPGIDLFIERDIPFLKKYDTKIIVNVCGKTTEDYLEVVERLADQPVDMLEINISCPNVKEGGIAFGQDPKAVEAITKAVKAKAKQPVIMKLSPNVTDITEMARAAEAGGADVLSLINTLTGMKIDIERQCFVLQTALVECPVRRSIRIAVRMVYQTAQAVKIPIIGMGGIMTAEDAIEMILAGATAVSVGTANFTNPSVTMEIADGIKNYMECHQVADIRETEQYTTDFRICRHRKRKIWRSFEEWKIINQEFIEFMVESDVLKVRRFYVKERKKISVFHECGRICDRYPVKETGRVLRKGDPRKLRG